MISKRRKTNFSRGLNSSIFTYGWKYHFVNCKKTTSKQGYVSLPPVLSKFLWNWLKFFLKKRKIFFEAFFWGEILVLCKHHEFQFIFGLTDVLSELLYMCWNYHFEETSFSWEKMKITQAWWKLSTFSSKSFRTLRKKLSRRVLKIGFQRFQKQFGHLRKIFNRGVKKTFQISKGTSLRKIICGFGKYLCLFFSGLQRFLFLFYGKTSTKSVKTACYVSKMTFQDFWKKKKRRIYHIFLENGRKVFGFGQKNSKFFRITSPEENFQKKTFFR